MEERNPMGYKPILPLLVSMAFPPMLSMLIQSLYNIIDSIFVAKLGESALTAVSLIYPLQNLSLAFSCGVGIAMNALIARHLGANDPDKASYVASQGMVMTLLHSLLFVVMGLFFIRPFVSLFSNQSDVIEYGVQYGLIVITFTFGSFIHIAIEKMFQAVGNMITPMFMQLIGAVVNIILDPILIFGYFGLPALGVSGAALATIIGQFVACFVSIGLFIHLHTPIHMSFKHFKIDFKVFKELYSIALPSGMMMCLPSVLVSCLNGILSTVSQSAVAFFGVYYKLQTFLYLTANGIVQGMRPIIAYNYGAGEHKRVRQIYSYVLIMIAAIMAVGTVICLIIPSNIISLFTNNDETVKLGATALRIISAGFVVSAVSVTSCGALEGLSKGFPSLVISLCRYIVIIIPAAFILSRFFGAVGVWHAFWVAELLTAVISLFVYKKSVKLNK